MMMDYTKGIAPREELKEKIILAALRAFSIHGIKSIRMDDIANSLRMSKRTLYEVFADKETLLKECILYHQVHSQEALEEIVRSSKNVLEVILKCYQGSIAMYHRTNKKFFEDIKKYPKVYELILNNRENDNTVVIDFLKRGVKQGIFRADVNFPIVHILLREQIDLMMSTKVFKEFSFLEVYESIIFTYLRGIATEKGAKELDEFIIEYRKEHSHKLESEEK